METFAELNCPNDHTWMAPATFNPKTGIFLIDENGALWCPFCGEFNTEETPKEAPLSPEELGDCLDFYDWQVWNDGEKTVLVTPSFLVQHKWARERYAKMVDDELNEMLG